MIQQNPARIFITLVPTFSIKQKIKEENYVEINYKFLRKTKIIIKSQ